MNFIDDLNAWLSNNCIDVSIEIEDEFMYDCEEHIVFIGTYIPREEAKETAQFLHEYGARLAVPHAVMAFIHELGHYATMDSFSVEDRELSNFLAMLCDTQMEYCETPVEFSANMWAVDFINTFPKKVKELVDIFREFKGK